jgi:hypothetical protein
LLFFLHGAFVLLLFLSFAARHFALHRVLFALCMNCLDAGSVPVGVREESRCCYLSDGLRSQNAYAVIGRGVVATGNLPFDEERFADRTPVAQQKRRCT